MGTSSKEAWKKITERAWTDDAFRQQLVDNPNKVLKDAGVDVPAGVNFVVVENEPDRLHLVLPSRPGEELTGSVANKESLSEYNAAVAF
jgi:hypothetical protein